ncbi:MAG: V-type ATP synthase subunit I [Halobacteriota archaeon]
MLRPERMSRASIAGAKPYLDDVIEVLHDLNLVHVTDYDGRWEGFENGAPLEGGEETSQRLVQVRAMMNTLDVEANDYDELGGDGHSFAGARDEMHDTIERVRQQVNELDDRRAELRDELRSVRERRRTVEPFAELGVEFDLLRGYDSIEIATGRTSDPGEIDSALERHDEVDAYEVIGDEVVAVAAYADEDSFDDALAGVDLQALEVPDERGEPQGILDELARREDELENEIADVEDEIDDVRERHGAYLIAAEEELSIESQKTEAPLRFATTANSFYAEGWVPTERLEEIVEALESELGSHVEVEELETVEYDENGHAVEHTEDDGEEAEHEGYESPPVKQDNPGASKPFEVLVNTVNRPKYTELDPTFVVFLTFPVAFGFMIGDIGYGLFYVAMGAAIYRYVDSDAMKALGAIAIWAGVFTILFGYLYDDMFGVHLHDVGIDLPLKGVLSKGIEAADVAQTWLVVSILFGILHLNVAYAFGFVNHYRHSLRLATQEYLSWMLIMNGFFAWVLSTHAPSFKPAFLVGESSVFVENSMFSLGFEGLPAEVGLAGLGIAVFGAAIMIAEEKVVGAIELPAQAFGHVLSYLRIMAVLLAKGGMAFVVNLLVFGAYEDNGHTSFGLYQSPADVVASGAGEAVAFPGLVWLAADGGAAVLVLAGLAAVLVFVVGHVLVLLLGITAAGIQMVRLEYVEFFGKFYEGGGRPFEAFGRERSYTEDG